MFPWGRRGRFKDRKGEAEEGNLDATSSPAKVAFSAWNIVLSNLGGVELLVGKRRYMCGKLMSVETSTSTPPSAETLLLTSG